MLKIDGLRVNYGGIEAVKDITFEAVSYTHLADFSPISGPSFI